MWMFAASLFMYKVYPGSLLLPAVYGFITSLCVGMFGTIAGDWVDFNPRMRGTLRAVNDETPPPVPSSSDLGESTGAKLDGGIVSCRPLFHVCGGLECLQ